MNVVGALGSQAQHVRDISWVSWETAGRSWGIMWCFGMCHLGPWRMTVVCVGLALIGANSRVSGESSPVTGGTALCFEPSGM